jgi:hypothetical protein
MHCLFCFFSDFFTFFLSFVNDSLLSGNIDDELISFQSFDISDSFILGELSQIKDKLNALLAENERVTDIERLERDEFVIDVARQQRVVDEGEKECEEIRKEAEKTVHRLELLRARVKQSTWDKMEVQ